MAVGGPPALETYIGKFIVCRFIFCGVYKFVTGRAEGDWTSLVVDILHEGSYYTYNFWQDK
jgi:hypothetical protein